MTALELLRETYTANAETSAPFACEFDQLLAAHIHNIRLALATLARVQEGLQLPTAEQTPEKEIMRDALRILAAAEKPTILNGGRGTGALRPANVPPPRAFARGTTMDEMPTPIAWRCSRTGRIMNTNQHGADTPLFTAEQVAELLAHMNSVDCLGSKAAKLVEDFRAAYCKESGDEEGKTRHPEG